MWACGDVHALSVVVQTGSGRGRWAGKIRGEVKSHRPRWRRGLFVARKNGSSLSEAVISLRLALNKVTLAC
ncbi:hypothetical protein predicted by Glimmer/Critica [Acetobacter senegalensis]|uniref:Uncharacterized protein n=1 Tax=Acetobacter senegalensis TaxID=446692 RepID=A0A0U5ES03_9PROT|nr:hypothetical protein predicted by Glimmer/Critica [Acetobacter senegalensis]